MIKPGDMVWVNEFTLRGRPLKHEWYGKVVSIVSDIVIIKDTGKGSYKGEAFTRLLDNLELKEE